MILSFRVLGYEVWALTFDRDPQDAEEEEEPPTGITGGACQSFERDLYPPNPSGEEPWTFGFRA